MFPGSKEVLKNDEVMSEGHKSHLEGVPSGQNWNNLSNKIMIMMKYDPQNKVNTE